MTSTSLILFLTGFVLVICAVVCAGGWLSAIGLLGLGLLIIGFMLDASI